MKEILFRGKTRDGKWIESCSVFMRGELALMLNERPIKEVIKDKNGEPVDVIFSFCSVEKNTVGQFTGLTDKKGKKVYVGDIIKASNNFYSYTVFVRECKVCIEDKYGNAIRPTNEALKHFECEVIGTVFDRESDNGD